jgi:hypothetical protein
MLRFVLCGREVAQGRVRASRAIGVFQIGRKRRRQVPLGAVALKLDLLVLACLYESLDTRVVVRIPRTGHGPNESRFLGASPIATQGVLGAAVRAMEATREWAAALEGALQGGQRQSRIKNGARRLANDASGPRVQNDR